VVSLAQLRLVGLSASAVRKRTAAGRLHRIHRAVYAVGHARLTREGRWMAAVLACGPRAVLSHRSAAGLWGLRPDNRPNAEVSLPRRAIRPRAGIDLHAASRLGEVDLASEDGIPCTSVARTLLDLAEVVDRRGVERALDRAEMLRLFDLRAVEEVLARADGRRGAGVLRAVLAGLGEPTLTDTEIEELCLALCDRAGLARPEVNAWLPLAGEEWKADFLWRPERLIVETDGRASHDTRLAFERDRRRDRRLALAGYRVLRFTWREVRDEPEAVAATIGSMLGGADAGAGAAVY
jgi:hypothetical protein